MLCSTSLRGNGNPTPKEKPVMKRILTAAAAIAAAALIVVAAVAAAGSGTSSAPKTSRAKGYGGAAAIPPARASRALTIGVRRTSHGRTLVDAQGRTLYL